MIIALVTAATIWSPTQACVGSQFCHKGDRWCGGKSPALGREVRHDDWGVAMRNVPYWTKVKIEYRGKTVVAPVIDHGPYGAIRTSCAKKCGRNVRCRIGCRKKDWKVMRRPTKGWEYVGCIDMTPPVAKALGFPGLAMVEVQRQKKARQRLRHRAISAFDPGCRSRWARKPRSYLVVLGIAKRSRFSAMRRDTSKSRSLMVASLR